MSVMTGTDPIVDWRTRGALSVRETATVLDTTEVQVYRLIDDWAFGDPAKLPTVAVGSKRGPGREDRRRHGLRVPVVLVEDFLAGRRQYPPNDPRGRETS